MAAFVNEVLLDPCYAAGAHGGAEFSTAIISAPSGFRQRNINRLDHIGRWQIQYDLIKDQDALDLLLDFFLAHKGMGYLFRFKPPEFNTITDAKAHIFGAGNASQTVFPLYAKHGVGALSHDHRITKPMAGGLTYVTGASTIKIFVNGVLQSSGVTVSSTTGLVTFSSAPANAAVLKWSGEFHVPVSFGRDTFDGMIDVGGVSQFGIEIIESLPVELGL